MYGTLAPPTLLEVGHSLVRRVDTSIFLRTFVPDCMSHACACRDEGDRGRLDACCQHGADVYPIDKEAILRRADAVASVLRPERRDPAGWFDEEEAVYDPDPPTGLVIRTATSDPEDESSGCVFLEHEGPRGCGLHRAAMIHGFDPSEIKPFVCRLYPLSLNAGELSLSSDFDRYSCADGAGPSVYRLMRATLAETFGLDLVTRLDRVERDFLPRRLPIVVGL
jgi:Fe-S-cluster containining protein